MKYLNKFNESEESFKEKDSKFLNSLSDEELQEKLDYLRGEMKEIQDDISSVYSIIKARKNYRDSMRAEKFPKSILDFNKDQLDFIFEHHHGSGEEQYKISQRYFKQLYGVMQSGFNTQTNQHIFNICTSYIYNDDDRGQFDILDDETCIREAVRSVKFLGDNLKKMDDGSVLFNVQFAHGDSSWRYKVNYFSENRIMCKTWGLPKEFTDVKELLVYLANEDWSDWNLSDDY